jgi:hypothetical protein
MPLRTFVSLTRHLSHGPDTAMTQQPGLSRQLTSEYHAAAWRPRKGGTPNPGIVFPCGTGDYPCPLVIGRAAFTGSARRRGR